MRTASSKLKNEVNHVARAPLQTDQPSSVAQVGPQTSVVPIPATDAPASSSVPVSHTSLVPTEERSNNVRPKELPIGPSPDKAQGKIEPTSLSPIKHLCSFHLRPHQAPLQVEP